MALNALGTHSGMRFLRLSLADGKPAALPEERILASRQGVTTLGHAVAVVATLDLIEVLGRFTLLVAEVAGPVGAPMRRVS